MQAIIDEDDGELWGINLSTPFMFADRETDHIVANQQDNHDRLTREGDVYVGVLPGNPLIVDGAVGVGGMLWGMMVWSGSETIDAFMLQTMISSVFHVVQRELFEGSPQGVTESFYTYTSEFRTLIRLELAALLRAMYSETEAEKLAAIHDALSIRDERRERVLLHRGDRETEIISGTAFYTSLMLLYDSFEERMHVIETKAENITRVGAATIFGALYGFLLDDFEADWKTGFNYQVNFGDLLQEAVGIQELTPFRDLDLEIYGYSEIAAQEAERLEARRLRREHISDTFRNYQWLSLEAGLSDIVSAYGIEHFSVRHDGFDFQFDYWYGDLIVISSEQGRLTVRDGYLRIHFIGRHPHNHVAVLVKDITIEKNRAFGHNWELELNDGFEIFAYHDGSWFEVRRVRN